MPIASVPTSLGSLGPVVAPTAPTDGVSSSQIVSAVPADKTVEEEPFEGTQTGAIQSAEEELEAITKSSSDKQAQLMEAHKQLVAEEIEQNRLNGELVALRDKKSAIENADAEMELLRRDIAVADGTGDGYYLRSAPPPPASAGK